MDEEEKAFTMATIKVKMEADKKNQNKLKAKSRRKGR